jgi:uncharacterized protein YciI
VSHFVVRLARGGGSWDWSRPAWEQAGWDEHARFMDGLADSGFVVLAGPFDGDREVLLIAEGATQEAVLTRLSADPWAETGMLSLVSIERWHIALDGRHRSAPS